MITIASDESYFPNFNRGIENLTEWRGRYSKIVYPEKVMLNILYRQHTVNFMWSFLHEAFEESFIIKNGTYFTDFVYARNYISEMYEKTKIHKTHPVLMSLIQQRMNVGGFIFDKLAEDISIARTYDNRAIERLEYAYLYSVISNENIFRWSACGMMGKNKQQAFDAVTEVILNVDGMTNYDYSIMLIGESGAGEFLHRNYQALQGFF